MKLIRITSSLVVLLLSLVAFSFVAVHPAAAQQALNPPPSPDYTCKTVGNGTICTSDITFSYGPDDTGLVCGSGTSAFDIFDSATGDQHKTRSYDQNGNLTSRVIHENYSSGQFSNPLTGTVVPYTQHDTITDDLAVLVISAPQRRRMWARTSSNPDTVRLCLSTLADLSLLPMAPSSSRQARMISSS